MGEFGLTGWQAVLTRLQALILPTFCIFFINFGSYAFRQRSLLLDTLSADYVRTARAKGLTKHQAIRRHALRTSVLPNVVTFAFAIPGAFTGAMMTETIFAWNGMGKYAVDTIIRNDINGAVAAAAFGALMTAAGAVLSDFVVVALDPRVRVS
jgi:peptide/nickel transport system permease protein